MTTENLNCYGKDLTSEELDAIAAAKELTELFKRVEPLVKRLKDSVLPLGGLCVPLFDEWTLILTEQEPWSERVNVRGVRRSQYLDVGTDGCNGILLARNYGKDEHEECTLVARVVDFNLEDLTELSVRLPDPPDLDDEEFKEVGDMYALSYNFECREQMGQTVLEFRQKNDVPDAWMKPIEDLIKGEEE